MRWSTPTFLNQPRQGALPARRYRGRTVMPAPATVAAMTPHRSAPPAPRDAREWPRCHAGPDRDRQSSPMRPAARQKTPTPRPGTPRVGGVRRVRGVRMTRDASYAPADAASRPCVSVAAVAAVVAPVGAAVVTTVD